MTTEYKWRVILFIRPVDINPTNRDVIANLYLDNSSGETLENERKLFDNVMKLSTTGSEPAQAIMLNLVVKTSMKDSIISFVSGLTNPEYILIANTTLSQYTDGEIIQVSSNLPSEAVGQIFNLDQLLQWLETNTGLRVIQP